MNLAGHHADPALVALGRASFAQRARWGVFDSGMKQVAIFDYNQRAAADQKVADLTAKKNGTFFLQVVKEAMPDAIPAESPVD